MRTLLCTLLLLSAARGQETVTSLVEDLGSAQDMLFDVALDFHNGSPPDETCVRQLERALRRICSAPADAIPLAVRSRSGWQADRESLSFALFELGITNLRSVHPDTLHEAFRQVFYAFHRMSQPFLLGQTLEAHLPAVLLFAASLTCECQRKLCDEYAAELIRLHKEVSHAFGLIIIDSSTDPEMLTRYDVDNVPTAIALDGSNNIVNRVDATEFVKQRLAELWR